MTPVPVIVGFFVAVLGATVLLGFVAVVRRQQYSEGESPSAPRRFSQMMEDLGGRLPAARAESALRRKLLAAGYRSVSAVAAFNGISYCAAGVSALIGFCAMLAVGRDIMSGLTVAVCAGAFAYLIPARALEALTRARNRRLISGLPTGLDLMVLALDAGQSVEQTLADASRELRRVFPDLADEFGSMTVALRASTSREEVFRGFSDRHNDAEIRRFCMVLIDSDRFGTSLGPALRTHARYLRLRRRQHAQEAARKTGVKLVFPIFFLIFPSILLVTLAPAVIQIMKTLVPIMK